MSGDAGAEELASVLDRVRELTALLGRERFQGAAEADELAASYRSLISRSATARTDVADIATSPPASEAAVIRYLDDLIVAARIGRSSLGTSAAQRISRQTTHSQIAEILRRRDELIAGEKHPDAAEPGPASVVPQGSRILVLGGDGFCGWPTSLYLSGRGHDVTIADNLSRRTIDVELGTDSLTPIRPISERLSAWHEVTGREIGFVNLDLATEYDHLVAVLERLRPQAIVHFAAQRAAPYSMRSSKTKRYTVDNNVRATHNLLTALATTGIDAALVHLGSMGVYGHDSWNSTPVPEGYLTVKVPTPDGDLEREILHPADPGSVYHMTKTLDELMFAFYAKNDGLRITDLHQGIVWGTQTDQTVLDERLVNRFDYDGEYGTVLNRFLMQGAIGYPLTVYGSGGQTRAFIHIRDTVRCIEIAIDNPPVAGTRPRVLNQVTETHRVYDLANIVAELMDAKITFLPNPRQEADKNDLVASNEQFLTLGLNPTSLSEGLLEEITDIAQRYRDRADTAKIISRSVWHRGTETPEDLIPKLPIL
jgi:UDP-sulfoquinovose synthase